MSCGSNANTLALGSSAMAPRAAPPGEVAQDTAASRAQKTEVLGPGRCFEQAERWVAAHENLAPEHRKKLQAFRDEAEKLLRAP
jgi:hypothetical protein